MVKLFFVGIGIFILAVVGASAAVFTPLLAGVDGDLGGSPRLPFQSPVPQPAVDTVHGWLAQVTPSVWLAAVLGLVALLLASTVGTLVAQLVRRWKEHRTRAAELRWRAGVMAAREQVATSTAAYEALWV
jgi:hypothetical protein